jgi:NADP-dependent aldehyde dehydrogenase
MDNNQLMTTTDKVDAILRHSAKAGAIWRSTEPLARARLLEAIAEEMEALGMLLIHTAMEETHLAEARLLGERMRTTGQLRMYAAMLREGSWVEATIDTAREGVPDIRKLMVPLGPVVVFGASNFPFAYSTAGGDTASALAAGCPVIVKEHPAHARTSRMVAEAIGRAVASSGAPAHVFQHVEDEGFQTGKALVQHPLTKAVGFTGSLSGGMALQAYTWQRSEPIPVFAEMGSVNPIVVLPEPLSRNTDAIAEACVGSITLGVGQFCTNPGLMFGIDCPGLRHFIDKVAEGVGRVMPARMLHAGIQSSYQEKRRLALESKGVFLAGAAQNDAPEERAAATLAWVMGDDFLRQPLLHEEVFGPFSLMVVCRDAVQLAEALGVLGGQLTCSIWGEPEDLQLYPGLLELLQEKAGRVVMNGVPTGVAVVPSMMHGGPFPASTDSRFTAVGVHAVKRWIRPLAYQQFPDELLPAALQHKNSLGIWRLVNNTWTKADVPE